MIHQFNRDEDEMKESGFDQNLALIQSSLSIFDKWKIGNDRG